MEPDVEERKAFLLEAIKDTQAIIRALDFKANALLVVMTLLLVNANKVAAAAGFLTRRHDLLGYIALAAAMFSIITGAISAWSAILALAARFNPRSAVNPGSAKDALFLGSFFAGSCVTFRTMPFALGYFKPIAPANLDRYIERLPETAAEVVITLAYEQLKIATIREAKALAIRTGYTYGVATLALASAIWLCGLLLGSDVP